MIQTIKVANARPKFGKFIVFPESELAFTYLSNFDFGIELGAAAHNPFGLDSAVNVAPMDDEDFYMQAQVDMCGEYAVIDAYGDANHIPAEDDAVQYIISSHVVEHIDDTIGAFLEWKRALEPDGLIFMIVPKRDALPKDKGRKLTSWDELVERHELGAVSEVEEGVHPSIFTLDSLLGIIEKCNSEYGLGWVVLETQTSDDKVGNGFTIVARQEKEAPKPVRKRASKKKTVDIDEEQLETDEE